MAELVHTLRREGKLYMRWRDPVDGKRKEQCLSRPPFNITSRAQAKGVLARKAKEISDLLALTSSEVPGQRRRRHTFIGIDELADEYLTSYMADRKDDPERAARETAATKGHIDRFVRWLKAEGIKRSDEITPDLLEEYRDDVRARNLARPTKRDYVGRAITFLSWARQRKFLAITSDDITDSLRIHKTARDARPRPSTFSRAELIAILRELPAHDERLIQRGDGSIAAWLLLCLLTGCRPGEPLRLRWRDIDLTEGWIYYTKTKTYRDRKFPLMWSPLLWDYLKGLHEGREGELVCGGRHKIPRPRFKALCEDAGVQALNPKLLRSTLATLVPMNPGAPTSRELALRMGHDEATQREHYSGDPEARHRQRGANMEQWLEIEEALKACIERLVGS